MRLAWSRLAAGESRHCSPSPCTPGMVPAWSWHSQQGWDSLRGARGSRHFQGRREMADASLSSVSYLRPTLLDMGPRCCDCPSIDRAQRWRWLGHPTCPLAGHVEMPWGQERAACHPLTSSQPSGSAGGHHSVLSPAKHPLHWNMALPPWKGDKSWRLKASQSDPIGECQARRSPD